MRWASAASERPETEEAFVEAAARLATGLGGAEPDVLFVFVSPHHAAAYARIPTMARGAFPRAVVLGASAGGVIGAGRELEDVPAIAMSGATMPGVEILPFAIADPAAAGGALSADTLAARLGLPARLDPAFLLIADPFSFDTEAFLRALDGAYPGAPKVGGLASGATGPGQAALFLGEATYSAGLVGLALTGNVRVETIVAQGCRPIGEPFIVTRHQENVIFELDRGRPLDVLRELVGALDPRDRTLARHSLFLGVQMRDQPGAYRKGDFLVRNLIGMIPDRGALAVGANLAPYQVVQFHLRDAATSAEDLRWHLATWRETQAAEPAGALLFSCLGRGRGLYGEPDHDSRAFAEEVGPAPLGGFFCNGEIGPVGGTTFVHGYTSSFALFSRRLAS